MTPRDDAEQFWERHHHGTRRAGPGQANPLLVETAGPLPPGTARHRRRTGVHRAAVPPATRWSVGPAGETATVTDNVLLIRRIRSD
jgi:hypothetical protein